MKFRQGAVLRRTGTRLLCRSTPCAPYSGVPECLQQSRRCPGWGRRGAWGRLAEFYAQALPAEKMPPPVLQQEQARQPPPCALGGACSTLRKAPACCPHFWRSSHRKFSQWIWRGAWQFCVICVLCVINCVLCAPPENVFYVDKAVVSFNGLTDLQIYKSQCKVCLP